MPLNLYKVGTCTGTKCTTVPSEGLYKNNITTNYQAKGLVIRPNNTLGLNSKFCLVVKHSGCPTKRKSTIH